MSLSRRGLLGLAAAAPVAAAAAGPSGLSGWLQSLIRGRGSYSFGRPGTWTGLGTLIDGRQIVCGSISAESIRVGGIGNTAIGASRLRIPGSPPEGLGVFSTKRRYRPEVATNSAVLRETQDDSGRLLVWEGGIIEVNPENSWLDGVPGFSGLYIVDSGSVRVRGASQIALTLESDEEGSRLVPVTWEDVPDLSGRCVVSVWSSDVLGVSSRVTGNCREWPDRPGSDPRPSVGLLAGGGITAVGLAA